MAFTVFYSSHERPISNAVISLMNSKLTHSRRDVFVWKSIKSSAKTHTHTHTTCSHADTLGMEISTLLICLILSLSLCQMNSALKLNTGLTLEKTGAEATSVKCKLQGATRLPVFSLDGDYIIGGVFSIHHYKQTVMHNYTTMPELQKCRGRSVRWRIMLQSFWKTYRMRENILFWLSWIYLFLCTMNWFLLI